MRIPSAPDGLWSVLPVPVFILDADGQIQEANAAARELLGSEGASPGGFAAEMPCRPFPWLGRDLSDLTAGHKTLAGVRSVAIGGRDREFEARYQRLEGGSSSQEFALLTLVERTPGLPEAETTLTNHGGAPADRLGVREFVLIVDTDLGGVVTQLNETAERALGCAANELIGKCWFSTSVYPADEAAARKRWARLAEGRESSAAEVSRVRTRAGGIRAVSWRRSLLHEEGAPAGVRSIGWDVTELYAARERLRASEERHRTLLASLPQRIFVKDQQGAFVSVNDAFAGDFGRRAVDFVGKTDFDLFEPELAEKYRDDDRRVIETGQTETIVEANVTQGKPRFVEVIKAPVVTDDGNVLGVVGVFTDITERKQMEEELARERDHLHILMDNLPDQIYFKDRESRFTRVNRATVAALGLKDESEALGRCDAELHPPDLAAQYLADERRLMETGEPLVGKLEAQRDAAGKETWLSTTKVPIRDRDGFVVGVAGISRDLSDRIRIEEELRQTADELARSNEELQQFAYVASHDLQEPLRMVASYTQLLARRYKDRLDQDGLDFINYAVDGATRMQGLIQDLLVYSRVGTRAGTFERVELAAAMDRALANLHAAVNESEAEITRGHLPSVLGDVTQLAQLFQNLLGNAIKFRGAEKPRIHVSAEQSGSEWIISVQDNGIGIEEQYRERIFVIFQRLHGKGEYPGTGIGLSICKKIVSRHGGRIWVGASGEGTTMLFTIPVRLTEQPGVSAAVES